MTFSCFKNDCKRFLHSKSLILLISLLPIVLLLILSYTMENVVAPAASQLTESKETLLYDIHSDADQANQAAFKSYQMLMETSLVFRQEPSAARAKEQVKKQKAAGYITIKGAKVNYYRSPYNESDSGKRIRSTFENYFGKAEALNTITTPAKIIPGKMVHSREYFTFAALGFGILYIALVTSQMTFQEKQQKTIQRFFLSKASILSFFTGKLGLGILITIYQFFLVMAVSHLLLGVHTGAHFFRLLLLYVCFGAMSSLAGIFIGISSKTQELASGWVLMTAIFTGLLGGGLIPLSALEGSGIVRFLTLFSPLRWLTKSALELSRNVLSTNLYISLIISAAIAVLFLALAFRYVSNKDKKGVLIDV